MKIKLFCPNCERCLGHAIISDKKTEVKILTKEPEIINQKQAVHMFRCRKCKCDLFISMEFKD